MILDSKARAKAKAGLQMSALALSLTLGLYFAAGCAHAPRPAASTIEPHPTSVPTGAGAFGDVVALATAREWTVRAVTIRGDTLVGRVSQPARDRLRIHLKNVNVDEVSLLERKQEQTGSDGGLEETRLLAGAAVGAMTGLVVGWLLSIDRDASCGGCTGRWALGGALVGLLAGAPHGGHAGPSAWIPIWRRE